MDGYDDSTLSPASTSPPMADSSCSHWWHGPFYLAMSIALAYMAFAATKHPRPEIPHPGPSLAASRALRAHGGFHITATLLQISPELFFSGTESTVFAIHDSAISNLSAPPWAMRQLLRYHAAPSALPMAALVKKPPGFCFRTLSDDKKLAVTGNGAGKGSVAINNVSITHPDLFLEGLFSVHGVSGPFDVDQPPPCDLPDRNASYPSDDVVQWTGCIRLLSSNGFVSFAVGLNSVVDGIIRDYQNLSRVSIFAPPNSGFISSSSPFLDKIVKIHILPQRFTYLELGASENSTLRTLVPGYSLRIDKFLGNLAINGVEITRPDLYVSDKFAIHGISRELDDVVHLSSSFM